MKGTLWLKTKLSVITEIVTRLIPSWMLKSRLRQQSLLPLETSKTATNELINERNNMTEEQKAAFQSAVQLLGLPVGTPVTVSYPPLAPAPVVETFTAA